MNNIINVIYVGILGLILSGCKKLIQIPPPTNTITTSQVFSTNTQAVSAMAGVYFEMSSQYLNFSNSGATIMCGLSADEFVLFDQTDLDMAGFLENKLVSTNSYVLGSIWQRLYTGIYGANAVISGLQNYSGVNDSVKNELTGEAEFVRAFCNFYLTNLFGNIPLVTTTNWQKTTLLANTPSTEIYTSIIADLKDAKSRMPPDYSVGQGQRIVPNKWVAAAFLARTYLYLDDWKDAIAESDSVINVAGIYQLNSDVNNSFLANNSEAIWQLQQNNRGYPYNVTEEGSIIIPYDSTTQPYIFLTNELLGAFESGDQRRIKWVDSTTYNGIQYYFPFKYKGGPAQAVGGAAVTEYYMVLRLSEQYLIKAEAEAQSGDSSNAISDLNIIRGRAGLPGYNVAINGSLLQAIFHERQIELFAEWGHRWMDLKREVNPAAILSATKAITVNSNALLYPIPRSDLEVDPNLTQNLGY